LSLSIEFPLIKDLCVQKTCTKYQRFEINTTTSVDYTPWTVGLQAIKLVTYMNENFNEVCVQLGRRLTAFRKRMGISQEELAFRAEIDRTYISQMERGVCNPSLLVLCKVANVLEINVIDFFQGHAGAPE
jgi:DNA-binding XRE family transcriptional regulator